MLEQDLNNYWETVVDAIQDGLMVVDGDGIIVRVNQALEEITGYARGRMIGKACTMHNRDICEAARDGRGEHGCSPFPRSEARNGTVHPCILATKTAL